MFCLYSKGCEYAIRAMAEISAGKEPQKFRAQDICRKAGIPEAYARKTFQALVQNGFLSAAPGPGGGYSLARDSRTTTVMDVIEAVEGKHFFNGCVLGFDKCNDQKPCSLHSVWMGLKVRMIEALGSRTLLELSRSIQKRAKKTKKRNK